MTPIVRLVAQSGYRVAVYSLQTCGTAMTTAGLTDRWPHSSGSLLVRTWLHESFRARILDEPPNDGIFCTLAEARVIVESWCQGPPCTNIRPGSLGGG